MPLATADKANFDTLRRAVMCGEAALIECQLVATGEPVAVICAINHQPDKSLVLVPLAQLFSGNPYESLNPPTQEPATPALAP